MTTSVEDYLKTIYKVQLETQDLVKTQTLSDQLKITPASVTEMVKKLATKGLVSYSPYQGVALTPRGVDEGKKMVRRHRIIELYIHQLLNVPWDQVHDEAERLEHAISDSLINRMEEVLGFPEFDPHGDPIPQKDGRMPVHLKEIVLMQCPVSFRGTVVRISHDEKGFLSYLDQVGIHIGSVLEVSVQYAFDQSLDVIRESESVHLTHFVSQHIWVVPHEEKTSCKKGDL